jgi:hypothetical protein
MFKSCKILTFFTFSLMGHQASASDFPIVFDCEDQGGNLHTQLKVELSPAKNKARLSYKTRNMVEAVVIGTENASGPYSFASVAIESYKNNRLGDKQGLSISGHMTEVLETSTYTNFSLALENQDEGKFKAKQLYYATGKVAQSGGNVENRVNFDNLVCSTEGL